MPAMILGERVRLRRIERADLPRMAEWMNDPQVREGLANVYPFGLVHEEQWFEGMLKLEPAAQPFAIEAKGRSRSQWMLIGAVGFHGVDWRNRSAEAGIFIGRKDLWNQGYGTDALRALARWGFAELNVNRVWLRVYEDNARAIRSYEKVGFRPEGRLRQDRFHRGRYFDTIVMALLREEFGAPATPGGRASRGAGRGRKR